MRQVLAETFFVRRRLSSRPSLLAKNHSSPASLAVSPRSKIIAPTISLRSGKIVYNYYVALNSISSRGSKPSSKSNSSVRAHVDLTEGILVRWMDGVRGGRGEGDCWVTECRIPLGAAAAGPLAADVRVGRRWVI